MALASPIHRPTLRTPLRFDPSPRRARSLYSLSRSLFAAAAAAAATTTSSSSSSLARCRRGDSLRVWCAKGTEKEDVSVTELETSSTQTHDKIDNDGRLTSNSTPDSGQDVSTHVESSFRTVALWVCAAVTFGIAIGLKDGVGKASEYFAGYLLEQSLSVDNLFVFVLIFRYFKVPKMYQSRVLTYGIAGAVIFRAVMILLGAATLQRFEAVNLLLALILLFSSYKLFSAEEDETDLADNFIVKTCQKFIPVTAYYDGHRFFTTQDGAWKATPLLLTLAVVELSDIAFAIDSIPAVFGVTRDPFIVFSSNLFAITGLRSLYILISESMSELEYLQPAIGTVLGFIGTKMIFDFFGYHIPTEISLGFVAACLSAGVVLSITKKSE
ncbi:thylakoid membrane protein TERC, chloroplastic isoform X2 [Ananas comosus]|uniref:Thylakoid membrane protein TERC, chloroplastic isoform X2 n=1 Tax=Ananas comosus TaxID=4615 RepID=A0A6P5ES01_ANACO|nr:thylakoid membrane protein TERC, chloroplastic isoform X2 [Ananas comosus]